MVCSVYMSDVLTRTFMCECRYYAHTAHIVLVASKKLIIVMFFLQGFGNSAGQQTCLLVLPVSEFG